MVQGCSLKRFLHVPQEAAGGYIDRGEYFGVIRRALPFFYTEGSGQEIGVYIPVNRALYSSGDNFLIAMIQRGKFNQR